jgi:hypothetical protein
LVFPDTLTRGGGGVGVTDGVAVRLGRDVAEAAAVEEGVAVSTVARTSTGVGD